MGTVNVWDMKGIKTFISSTPVLQILNPKIRPGASGSANDAQEQNPHVSTIENVFLLDGGVPVFSTTSGELYTFHDGIKSWINIADKTRPLYSSIDVRMNGLDTFHLDYSNIASNSLGDLEV